MKKIVLLAIMAIVLTVSGSCSGKRSVSDSGAGAAPSQESSDESLAYSTSADYNYEDYDTGESSETYLEGEVPTTPQTEKKIITADMSMETNQFDYVFIQVREIAEGYGGYVQSSNSYIYFQSDSRVLKAGNITAKIPSGNYDEAKNRIGELGRVIGSNEYTDDATETYYDAEARLTRKQAEENRLIEMIGEAEKLEDLIELEKRLAEVRADIEIYQSRLDNIDRLSSYSTLNLSLREVTDETISLVSDDFPSRIRSSFIGSFNATIRFFENLIVFLAGTFVPIVLILTVIAIIALTAKIFRKKNNVK